MQTKIYLYQPREVDIRCVDMHKTNSQWQSSSLHSVFSVDFRSKTYSQKATILPQWIESFLYAELGHDMVAQW